MPVLQLSALAWGSFWILGGDVNAKHPPHSPALLLHLLSPAIATVWHGGRVWEHRLSAPLPRLFNFLSFQIQAAS